MPGNPDVIDEPAPTSATDRMRHPSAGVWSSVHENGLMIRQERLALLLIVVAAVLLRAFRLGHQSLWTDEIVSALSADGRLWWVLTQTSVNSNIPPLYYAVLHLVMSLSRQEWVLRLPSLLSGVASVPLFFAIVREWLGSRVALVCAALVAISPFHVWYSQEARPYALLLFLSLLSLRLLQLLVARPGDRWLQLGFVLSAAATFYAHTLGLPFLAYLAVLAIRETPKERWGHWLRLFAAIGLLLIPAVYRLIVFAPSASADASRTFGLAFVPYAVWAFATGYSIGPTLTQLHLPSRLATTLRYWPLILPIGLIVVTLATAGAVSLWKWSRATFWMVGLWLAFPLAFALLGTLATRHPFNVRYVILSFPAFVIVVASGVLATRQPLWRAGAAAALLVVSALSLGNYYFVSRYFREDNRAAGHYLTANAATGDLVVADAPYTALNLTYYARRPDLTIVGYPPQESPASGAAGVLRGGVTNAATRPSMRADSLQLQDIIGARNRVWVFLSRTYHGVPGGVVLDFCDRHFRRLRQLETDNDILLILYERRPG